jgi:diguanylate cyclase (GGDEF)-like protein
MEPVAPGAFHDFPSACSAVLEYLHRKIGFDLWMVTRVEGEEWIILQVEDHGYGVAPGSVFRWADTFCYEMVKGAGPNIAPRVDCVKVYADAALGRNVRIGAYVGFPLTREDGSLFGTLCAVHPAPQPPAITAEQPLIALLTRMLSTVLAADLRTADGARREERIAAQKFLDPVTDLYDARGWAMLLSAEEARCRAYGSAACVIAVDIAAQLERATQQQRGARAGDEMLRIAARCITAVTREHDVVARVAPGSFAVLAVECDRAGAKALVARLNDSLAGERVDAVIATAHRAPPMLTLDHAWDQARRTAAEAKPA